MTDERWDTSQRGQSAEQWARQQMELLGLRPTGPVEDVSIKPWSAVWRIPTAAGPVLVKQMTSLRRREGAVQAFLADRAGAYVDRPLAYATESGRILLRDLGPTMLEADPDHRGIDIGSVTAMLTDYARLQHATIGAGPDAAASGLGDFDPGRATAVAVVQAHQLHDLPRDDPRRISGAQRDRILDARPAIDTAARVMADSPIPFCLDHGDLWPGNVIAPRKVGESHRFIDVGDAAWTHPFLSLIMLIGECGFRWAVEDLPDQLNLHYPAITAITDVYLGHWTDYAPMADLRTTLRSALQLAPLRRSQAWIDNLSQASPTELEKLGKMPWAWLSDVTRGVTGLK